ncbi:MAG: response regulator [Pseudomonadota bacterium]
MSETHILIVEDEPKIAQLLADYLQREGFSTTILNEGTHAVEQVQSLQPHFLILDLMLPGKDGLSICREVRQSSEIPIMMLTAKVDEIDRLLGLELGADDYVCKPFSPREVVARVRTILRRVTSAPKTVEENVLDYAGITLALERFECMANGARIELTPVEFNILKAFMARPGHVFSRDRLMDLAYPDERVVSDRTMDTHVKNLRRKLTQGLGDRELIHSIYGVGYKID